MGEHPAGRVVLASRSPRRLALLRRIGVEPQVRPADVDETPLDGEAADALAVRLAGAKRDATRAAAGDLVVAADTVVALDGQPLGKPVDEVAAADMLQSLSGRAHDVTTGLALARDGRTAAIAVTTRVTFAVLSREDVAAYVASGEPRGKAGAYALQGAAAAFVERLEGSHTNVIGLPLAQLRALAREVGGGHLLRVVAVRPDGRSSWTRPGAPGA